MMNKLNMLLIQCINFLKMVEKMNKEKVMLMYPNFKWTDRKEGTAWSPQPTNLCILATTIEDKYEVVIFDGNLDHTSKEEFYNIIEKENPNILGISVLTNEYGIAGSVGAGIAKRINPNIKVVMGGVHPTSLPDIVASDPNIDYAFICEGESISGRRPRLRSVENVVSEMERLISDYGIKTILFDDDNLLIDKKRAKNLFQTMIDRKYNLKWNAGSLSLFRLDEELIDLMEKSGCSFASCAIESGVQRVMDEIIHKPLKLDHVRKMMKKLKETNIFISTAFIVGFPNESWNEIRQTLRFAEEIDIDYVKINIATPLPNTEIYRTAKEKEYLVDGFRFDRHLWSDGWIKTKEFNPQNLKILRAYEWDRINFANPDKREKIIKRMGISEERLNEIRKNTLKAAHE